MIHYLKKLFHIEKYKLSPSQQADEIESPEIDFEDLHNNFHKRTYAFGRSQHLLASPNPRLLHWIGSVDYSGYVRETSLRYLMEHYEPGDENRILLRLEDWVPQVQRLAKAWVYQHFSDLSLLKLNDNYRLLLYLLRKERLRQDPIMTFIQTCMISKLQDVEQARFVALHPRFRRYLYRLAGHEYAILRERMRIDRDPFNRSLLIECYGVHALTPQECTHLKEDKSAFVRRAFLEARLQQSSPPSQQELQQLCLDPNPGIRADARFYLAKFYHQDAYNLYTQQQDTTFYYIADYARKDDLPHFLHGLSLPNRHLKYLCLQAICRIDPTQVQQLPVEELLTENRRIRKLLCDHLPHVVTLEQLVHLKPILTTGYPNGVHIFLNLIYRKSFWHFLDEALTLLLQEPTERHVRFVHHKFFQKSYIYQQLPGEVGHRLARKMSQLQAGDQKMITSLIEQMHFAIRSAGYSLK